MRLSFILKNLCFLFIAGIFMDQSVVYGEVDARKIPKTKLSYVPVVTPNGSTMPWTVAEDGAKVINITVGFCKHEIAEGMTINAWCYNGQTPGPTIEAVEGDTL